MLVKLACRYVKVYEYQDEVKEMVVRTDGDWTSCRNTRSSSSTFGFGRFLFSGGDCLARSLLVEATGLPAYSNLIKATLLLVKSISVLATFGVSKWK